MSDLDRVGYLTKKQFVDDITGTVSDNLSGTFQPLDATLTDLASRDIGAASATDILDRAAGDARYATTGSGVLSFNTRTGAVTLTSGDVTTALGFTPYNSTNPSGYISSITSLMVTTALGYTPTSVTGLTGTQSVAAFKAGLSLVKADVGLGSVDNTTDAAKNVLTATKLLTGRTLAITGDLTWTSPSFDGSGNVTAAGTLATVNSSPGAFGSATKSLTATVNGKGLITSLSEQTVTPAIGSITGFGTGVATALAVNIGSAGAFVTFNGALGTPSSGTLTNCTFPTLNQNTTGSAAKWTTARNLAGNSVDGSANVAFSNKFIVQGTTDSGLSAAQFLGALGTGIVKNTTTTGVLSIAVAGDFPTLNQSTTGSAATLTTGRTIAMTGDVTWTSPSFDGSGNVTAAGTIAAKAVTLAKMDDMATASLLGRNTAGIGAPEVLSASTSRSLLGLVIGTNVQAWDTDLDAVAASGVNSTRTTYTPTITPSTGTFTSASATGRYWQMGHLVFLQISVTITTNGTAAGYWDVSLPGSLSAVNLGVAQKSQPLSCSEDGVTGASGRAVILSSGTVVRVVKYDGTYLGANGYVVNISGYYEAA